MLFLKQEEEVHGKIRTYEKKIGSLMSEVGSLKTEVCYTRVTSAMSGYKTLSFQTVYRYFGLIIKLFKFLHSPDGYSQSKTSCRKER